MIPMKKVWKARKLILQGYKAKEVSELLGVSVSSIRAYTRSERQLVKSRM